MSHNQNLWKILSVRLVLKHKTATEKKFSFLTLLKLFYFTKIQQSCVTVKMHFINITLTPENALLQIYLNWRCVSSDHVVPLSESAVICRVFVALVPASSPQRARACYTIQSDSAISGNHCNATSARSKKRKDATSCGLGTYAYFLVGIKSAFTRRRCLRCDYLLRETQKTEYWCGRDGGRDFW